jgi:NEDD8-activating enzyme E1
VPFGLIICSLNIDTRLDNDNPEHIQWLFETASVRGKEFNITGITYSLTQGVVKNIIPAIASTNAIIAGFLQARISVTDHVAACCNEALKMVTSINPTLDNYMM